MILYFSALGACAGAVLVGLLAINLRYRSLRIWPTPVPPSWQSPVFWGLFRTLNICALALAAFDWQPMQSDDLLRGAAALVALAGGGVYLLACIHLGRDNLYCGAAGLVTSGIYGWSRNPQYALAMPTYLSLAIAAHSPMLALLVILLIAVFMLMAFAEEPWLEEAYAESYALYRSRVPRFYNVRRLVETLQPSSGRRPTSS